MESNYRSCVEGENAKLIREARQKKKKENGGQGRKEEGERGEGNEGGLSTYINKDPVAELYR